MTPRRCRRGLGALVVALATSVLSPSLAAAHAALQVAAPKDGATVEGSPAKISGTYSEAMSTSGSSLVLLGPDGKQVATGGVDPANNKRMAINPVPALAPGTYTVKSTTKSAVDGDIDGKEWSFTVIAAATAVPTLAPSAPATTSTTAAASATVVPATVASSPSPAPSAAVGGTSGGGDDVLLPIVVALALVGLGGALLLGRRGRAS